MAVKLPRLLLLTGLLTAFVPCAQAGRLALIIGNRDYITGPLRNTANDARDVAAKLSTLGFQNTLVINLKRDDIGITIDKFLRQIQAGDDVVVFYAGHGVQIKGVNYLPAVDGAIRVEGDVPLNSIDLNQLIVQLDEARAGVRVMLIDACRDNPYARSFRSGTRGLARMDDAPSGTLMHFATRPGGVAADGDGRNGLYTSYLLKHLGTPALPVESLLKRVSADVRRQSSGEQQPWTEGALDGEFYFVANALPTSTPPAPVLAQQPTNPTVMASSGQTEKVSFAADAYFPYKSVQFASQRYADKLTDLYEKVKGLDLEAVIAVGHASSDEGTPDAAQKLSVRRSEAVKTFLAQLGIPKERIYAEGKGFSQPVADNKTADGRAKNRRAEIEVVGTRIKP
jgi:outer membrane protein OmpA-like peptidoglycan-associated protein